MLPARSPSTPSRETRTAALSNRSNPAAMPLPPGAGQRVLHARLAFEGGVLMASDAMPGQPYDGMKNVGIAVTFATVERGRAVAAALAEGGKVLMPFGETFWVEGFGSVVDRFGTTWLVNGGRSKLD